MRLLPNRFPTRGTILLLVTLLAIPGQVQAYVEAPMPLGAVLAQSTNVCTMVITNVDKQKNLIIYKKVADIKGKHPQDVIKHNIGFGGLRPGEWQEIMNWAEVGKSAVFFHNGGASETFIGVTWYQAYPQGEWWGMSHGEPFLLRSYAGKVDKLGSIITDMLANREVIVPCMVDGDKEALHKKTAKVQRVRASLKIQDYNPKRDFVGWGGEDIRRLAGMPGFDRLAAIGNLGSDALAASSIDFDADGKPDICLVGANRFLLLQNNGDSFAEVTLPNLTSGARAAVWADHDGDGLPDLLLATTSGPRLFTNLGQGKFRDDTKRLPVEACYNLTAAAWLDADGDGKPDILLANGFHGLRLYRNLRASEPAKITPPKLGNWFAVGPFRHKDGPQLNYDFAFAPEKEAFDPNKVYRGKREMECKWTKGEYADGQVNGLGPFGANCAIYLHREIESPIVQEVPISFGNRDSVMLWLNGERLHAEKANRPATSDPFSVLLKLNAGKNRLLVKLVHGEGEGGFRFQLGGNTDTRPLFEDVTSQWGLGNEIEKGDSLTVADFNGDGKPDFLYGAGKGQLYLKTGNRYVLKTDSGIEYQTGKVGPTALDFDGDGALDLFVPQQDGKCRLFRNVGNGRFVDFTAKSGDLANGIPGAVSATTGDFDNDGYPDLVVTSLRGTNRFFHGSGNGTFADHSSQIGLDRKIYNSQASCLADLNGDGRLDLILANEIQDSVILFGSLAIEARRTPVQIQTPGLPVGGQVRMLSPTGQNMGSSRISGGDGRGGQSGLTPRFVLNPGPYRLEIVGTDGKATHRDLVVADKPLVIR